MGTQPVFCITIASSVSLRAEAAYLLLLELRKDYGDKCLCFLSRLSLSNRAADNNINIRRDGYNLRESFNLKALPMADYFFDPIGKLRG